MPKTMMFLIGIAAAQPVCGQRALFTDETSSRLPSGLAGQCMDAASGDVDDDGDLDLVLAMEFRPNLLLINDGAGFFALAAGALPVTSHDSEDVAFADFDGDGDPDLVLVSEDDRTDELYLNDGRGRFVDASERLSWNDVSNALAVTDLDGDGSPDLLTGNVGFNRALINDGAGGFTDRTAELWPQAEVSRTQDLELADVDGDGNPDVIVANEGQNQLFLHRAGRLIDATLRSLPARRDETREIRAADLDGDGDLDLIVANVSFLMTASLRDYLLFNDGNGVFSETDSRFPEHGRNNFSIQAADLDGDGDQDVLVPDSSFAGRTDRDSEAAAAAQGDAGALSEAQRNAAYLALLNDGSGAFAPAEVGRIIEAQVDGNGFDIEVADFTGDGAADLFLCNRALQPDPGRAAESGGRQRLLIRAAAGEQ